MKEICKHSDLTNESDVELFFIKPLLDLLGYTNKNIKNKKQLKELGIKRTPRGKEHSYRPDMVITAAKGIKFIIEAKSPTEKLDKWLWQPKNYALILNSSYKNDNPYKYYLITNGLETRVYRWDYDTPHFVRQLNDLKIASPSLDELRDMLSPTSLKSVAQYSNETVPTLELRRPSIDEINAAFAKCHQLIYKNDNISQSAAFFEFVKIISLKLISDKQIRDSLSLSPNDEKFEIEARTVKFSRAWVEAQEPNATNPLSDIWFRSFIDSMEKDIGAGLRKRIFEPKGAINLTAETIKEVVQVLEGYYLFGIDADLNGRLFETFLSATMRGKDLGQYFTPRSIVKLGVKMARLHVDIDHPENCDRVYDGCCGTGGFLIDVLADMWTTVDNSTGYSSQERDQAKDIIKTEHIWGCEVGKDPNLARIARLNMYLHGDGGATIFNLDGLDKSLEIHPEDTPDQEKEKKDYHQITKHKDGFFDVVVTNPPFAKTYKLSGEADEKYVDRLLNEYNLLSYETAKRELRSNLMFIERYHDLLKPGKRLLTVLDDGILSGTKYKWFRKWLFERFIVKAVISLPGDAFQRSKARVKTSLLILHKKVSNSEVQSDVFMYPCKYVGLDDPSRARSLPIDADNRKKAKEEIKVVSELYNKFFEGNCPKKHIVPANRIIDRLDVKNCLIKRGSTKAKWKKQQLDVKKLKDIAEPKLFNEDDIIDCKTHDSTETYLRVTYSGEAIRGEEIDPTTTDHSRLYRVKEGDIVISNIAATYGSIGHVTEETDGCVVSNEYTILVPKDELPSRVLWALLRSQVFRSEMLLAATGANRTRVRWNLLKNIEIPLPDIDVQEILNNKLIKTEQLLKQAEEERLRAINTLNDELTLETDIAETVLAAFKPPK